VVPGADPGLTVELMETPLDGLTGTFALPESVTAESANGPPNSVCRWQRNCGTRGGTRFARVHDAKLFDPPQQNAIRLPHDSTKVLPMGPSSSSVRSLVGRWRIVSMELWDQEYLDLEGPAHIVFKRGRLGSFQFGAVQGWLDYRSAQTPDCSVEFSWEGFGRGRSGVWARLGPVARRSA
jgi:hypothetical protein